MIVCCIMFVSDQQHFSLEFSVQISDLAWHEEIMILAEYGKNLQQLSSLMSEFFHGIRISMQLPSTHSSPCELTGLNKCITLYAQKTFPMNRNQAATSLPQHDNEKEWKKKKISNQIKILCVSWKELSRNFCHLNVLNITLMI